MTERNPKSGRVEAFGRLSVANRRRFLAAFIHNMTIAMREDYSLEPKPAAEKFRKWNELLHRIAGNLDAMLAASEDRYPDEVLIGLVDAAASDGLGNEIDWAWRATYRCFASSERGRVPTSRGAAAQ